MSYEERITQPEVAKTHWRIPEAIGSTATTDLCVFSPEATGMDQMPQSD